MSRYRPFKWSIYIVLQIENVQKLLRHIARRVAATEQRTSCLRQSATLDHYISSHIIVFYCVVYCILTEFKRASDDQLENSPSKSLIYTFLIYRTRASLLFRSFFYFMSNSCNDQLIPTSRLTYYQLLLLQINLK